MFKGPENLFYHHPIIQSDGVVHEHKMYLSEMQRFWLIYKTDICVLVCALFTGLKWAEFDWKTLRSCISMHQLRFTTFESKSDGSCGVVCFVLPGHRQSNVIKP